MKKREFSDKEIKEAREELEKHGVDWKRLVPSDKPKKIKRGK